MSENEELLAFNVKVLRWLNLWTTKESHGLLIIFKTYLILLPIIPALELVIEDLIWQINGAYEDITGITENLIAIAACFGGTYITTCFTRNREKIRKLIKKMDEFKIISDKNEVLDTEKKVRIYSKLFISYGIIGTSIYALLPLLQINECKIKRMNSKYSQDVPCGMVTRCIVKEQYNSLPYLIVLYIDQLYTCMILSVLTCSITALLCGFLMHTVTQIRYLKRKILNSCTDDKTAEEMEKEVQYCVQYHQLIIEYAKNLDKAFNTMMLMHLSVTSFAVSILGFEIIMVNSISDSLRFGLHLGGWIILLYLTCHYGQVLIDESKDIGRIAYNTGWYIAKPKIRRDLALMILRAQRPLTLSAHSLGIMSYELFLKVMSTAYSYFTLLLKVKN